MEYQSAVKTAEEAVASMKDPKLREIAFGQILARLLSAGKHLAPRSSEATRRSSADPAGPDMGKKKTGTIAWLRDLAAEGFFESPRNIQGILGRLAEQSHHLSGSDLTWPLQQLCHTKVLRRKKVVPKQGKVAMWHWSKW
ncbi:MAG: hypothetical protein WA373_04835 [Burkholderiales bacterium]